MALISYSILSRTLEDKIVVDRHTLVESLASLIDSDIRRTADAIEYYQNLPLTQRMVMRQFGDTSVQDWLAEAFYSHPQIDGMFITDAAGKLIASIPASLESTGADFSSKDWLPQTRDADGAYVSGLIRRVPDGRPATIISASVRTRSGEVTGYIGATVLAERIGKRLAALNYGEQSIAQVIDQNGVPFFDENFRPNDGTKPADTELIKALRESKGNHLRLNDNFVTFDYVEPSGWTAILSQPVSIEYKPVHDLVSKTSVIEAWLILGSIAAAWIVSRLYTRQLEATERFERETFLNEKILANMPVGIALIDPLTKRFLQANESFLEMAQNFGGVPPDRDIDT